MRSIRKSVFFHQGHTLERLSALTDGVYAIVLTLLVLDLKIPDTQGLSEVKIIDDLVRQIPNFFSYVISFFVVAGLWVKHYSVIKPLKECNEETFGLNFIHLLFVTLTPYTASLFGHYEEDPIVVFLFSGSVGLAAFSLHILHWYVIARPEWCEEDTPEEWKYPNWLVAYPATIIALISMPLAFISVTGAILVWIIFPLSLVLFSFFSRKPT
jgi:TMEM175 potassium channel family protein